jgi:glycosyltransferase involved in cell wall biosynthesis
MNPRASVILSFYNKIEWLKLVLASFERQTLQDFEIIIADDGSTDEVVTQVIQLQNSLPLHIQHVWHADEGFTKTRMLNKAVLAAKSDYLIFIDGDCIAHKNFVEDHVRLQKTNQLIAGRRVNLSDKLSKSLCVQNILKGELEGPFLISLFIDSIINKSKDVEKGIHLNAKVVNRNFGSYKKGLLGCNFSVHKNAILSVNGFDERYQHPGIGEDSEIEYRLKKAGFQVFSPKFCAVQYHLWHARLSRFHETTNNELYNDTQVQGYTYTPYGIEKKQYEGSLYQ